MHGLHKLLTNCKASGTADYLHRVHKLVTVKSTLIVTFRQHLLCVYTLAVHFQ